MIDDIDYLDKRLGIDPPDFIRMNNLLIVKRTNGPAIETGKLRIEAIAMKALLLLACLALLFVLPSFVHADASAFAAKEAETFNACVQDARQRMDENFCASQAFERADKKLNDMYRELISQKRKDPEYRRFVANLKKAQKAWVLFVNAHIASIYPEGAGKYGLYEPFCELLTRTSLTLDRIKQLSEFYDSDGDNVCGGFKINEK